MKGKGLILVTLCLAALIINLDTTIVNVALPALVRQLGATTTSAGYLTPMGACQRTMTQANATMTGSCSR